MFTVGQKVVMERIMDRETSDFSFNSSSSVNSVYEFSLWPHLSFIHLLKRGLGYINFKRSFFHVKVPTTLMDPLGVFFFSFPPYW